MLPTTKPYQQSVLRAKKETRQKEAIPQPTVVADYNFEISGTDGIDQIVSYYRYDLQSREWQPRYALFA